MPGSEVKGVNESLCIIIRERAAELWQNWKILSCFDGIVSHVCRCLNLYLNPTLKPRMLSTLLIIIKKN